MRKAAGEIMWYAYEPIKLRLAKKTFYTPDYLVQDGDGFLEIHEVKGFMQDDAAVKLKVTARTYPMLKILVIRKRSKKDGGGWSIQEVKP